MEGEHLDGVGVGVEPPRALVVGALAVGGGDPLTQPAGQRGEPELLGVGGGVQQLADVLQVGEPPLAADL